MNNNDDDKNKLSTLIPSTDVIQLTLTLKMTTAQVLKTSVTGTRQQSYSDYTHLNNHIPSTVDSR